MRQTEQPSGTHIDSKLSQIRSNWTCLVRGAGVHRAVGQNVAEEDPAPLFGPHAQGQIWKFSVALTLWEGIEIHEESDQSPRLDGLNFSRVKQCAGVVVQSEILPLRVGDNLKGLQIFRPKADKVACSFFNSSHHSILTLRQLQKFAGSFFGHNFVVVFALCKR